MYRINGISIVAIFILILVSEIKIKIQPIIKTIPPKIIRYKFMTQAIKLMIIKINPILNFVKANICLNYPLKT
jgi:hypothetical protein